MILTPVFIGPIPPTIEMPLPPLQLICTATILILGILHLLVFWKPSMVRAEDYSMGLALHNSVESLGSINY